MTDLTHVRFQGTPPRDSGRIGFHCAASPAAEGATALVQDVPPTVSGLPALVLEGAGLDPTLYRDTPLRRRTAACLRAMRAASEGVAVARLRDDSQLAEVALDAFLIGHSQFFRDPLVFETLRTMVIPALAGRARALRVASIGCSSGAELYSVAMLLGQAGVLDRSSLLGIDCRPAAVDFARRGVFDNAVLAAVDERLRERYVEPTPGGGRMAQAIREHTDWRVLDATRQCPPGPWHLVLCRNLVIYLQTTAAAAMFERLTRQLVPGGFLVVGNAERPPAALKLTQVARCVYRTHAA